MHINDRYKVQHLPRSCFMAATVLPWNRITTIASYLKPPNPKDSQWRIRASIAYLNPTVLLVTTHSDTRLYAPNPYILSQLFHACTLDILTTVKSTLWHLSYASHIQCSTTISKKTLKPHLVLYIMYCRFILVNLPTKNFPIVRVYFHSYV